MIVAKSFVLDFTQQYRSPIEVNQYEKDGRTFAIQCTAGNQPIDLTSAIVTFYAQKTGGDILYNVCTITDAVTGKITYTMTEQTCAEAGALQCWIEIIKNGSTLRSFEFPVTVRAALDESEAIESTSEFTALETALGTVGGYDGRIAGCESDITALDGRMDTAELGITALSPSMSLEQGVDGLHLVNDEASPANGKFYGIVGGARGFHAIPRSKIGTITRNMTDASGDVSYSGIGFKGNLVTFLASSSVAGTTKTAGHDNGSVRTCMSYKAGTAVVVGDYSINVGDGASYAQSAYIKSFDADGFTLTWVKTASPPAGTITIMYEIKE